MAIKFDLYANQTETNDSTGLYTNAAAPFSVGSIDLTNTGINLHSGDVFQVNMTYSGTTLAVTITDTVTKASATQTYTVNIPSVIGNANTAYVGFTAGTGGLTAKQYINNWIYTPGGALPAAPTVTAAGGTAQATLTWPAVTGATSYNVYRGTTAGGEAATPLATGVTSTSFTNTGLAAGTTYYYKVSAVNAGGEGLKSSEVSATTQAVPMAPTSPAIVVGNSQLVVSWTASSAATSYNVYRGTTAGGEATTPLATGITGTSFTDTGLANGTTYYYKVTAVNAAGESAKSAEVSATPLGINFAAGFSGATGLAFNGSAAKIVGTQLQLTDGGANEASSVYYNQKVDVTKFSNQFSFQLLSPSADGFTFIIQNNSTTALGPSGGALGYSNGTIASSINHSVAIKFDLYANQTETNDSTGLYTNAAAPFAVGSIDLTNTGINLHSGDVFQVNMTYSGTTLAVTITDTVTKASATQTYTVNIPSVIGNANTAYVGFTAGTGGLTAKQYINNWIYTPSAALAGGSPALGAAAAAVKTAAKTTTVSSTAATTSTAAVNNSAPSSASATPVATVTKTTTSKVVPVSAKTATRPTLGKSVQPSAVASPTVVSSVKK